MKTKILFVDDDIRVLSSFERVVHAFRNEWDFEFVSKSETVIDYLCENPTDVVVTDVKMPIVDGLELLKRIKSHPKLERIEVVVVTGLGERSLKQRALDMGASDLMNKPISNEELISRLKSVIRMKHFQDELLKKNHELEQQLIQIQKMDLIGLLAAGAVHDLNNILGIIKGYGRLMLKETEMTSSFTDDLRVVMESIDRAINITRQIHDFSRTDADRQKTVDLAKLIRDIRSSLVDLMGKTTEILVEIPEDSFLISAPESSAYQVCMNLCVNAIQAIQAMEGSGKLMIRIYREAEGEICIDFSDTGKGIDISLKDQIFEPFFTTRRESGGSGLGLSIVRKIMANLGGEVSVINNPEGGATFTIRFPSVINI